MKEIGKNLDLFLSKHDNFMLIGVLNAEPTESAVSDFCEIYNLKHLIKDKTCFKNPTKPTCKTLVTNTKPTYSLSKQWLQILIKIHWQILYLN